MHSGSILVADDDRQIRKMLGKILAKAGYAVTAVGNGREAIDAARSHPPDVAILDMEMPEMNGIEVLKSIKALDETISVIILTGHANPESLRLSIFENGAFDYLMKPSNPGEILQTVQNALYKRQYQDHPERVDDERFTKRINQLEADFERRTRELRESQIKYKEIVDNSNDVILVSQNGKIRFTSPNAMALTGYTRAELMDLGIVKLVAPKYHSDIFDAYEQLIAGRPMHAPLQLKVARSDGSTFWAETISKRTVWEGEPAEITFVTDISRQKAVEGELKAAHEELERRVEERTAELMSANAMLQAEVTERQQAQAELRDQQIYLRSIMDTIQTGVVLIDPVNRRIVDINPFACQLIGEPHDALIERDCHEFMCLEGVGMCPLQSPCDFRAGTDCLIDSTDGKRFHVRRAYSELKLGDRSLYLVSLSDITDIKELLKSQEISIGLARRILQLINPPPPQTIDLEHQRALSIQAFCLPCNAEGGDHFLVRRVGNDGNGSPQRTVISLKDQSGHQVSCVLRSIITDLIHNAILQQHPSWSLEDTVAHLNDAIVTSGLFNPEDFFTSLTLEIDHRDLTLTYLSTGHPPLLLIRGTEVIGLAEPGQSGTNLPAGVCAGAAFGADTFQMQVGDRLLMFTDGLTEMPHSARRSVLSFDRLKGCIGKILKDTPRLPVSLLMTRLLEAVSTYSRETVSFPHQNTSADDISIIGIEIEHLRPTFESVLTPASAEDCSRLIGGLNRKIEAHVSPLASGSLSPQVRLVLEETILNAWRHGSRQSADKTITVRCHIGNELRLEVTDQGNGFDWSQLPDPSAKENIARTSGRGLYLVRHFSRSVRWFDGGRRIEVCLPLFADSQTPAAARQNAPPMSLWEPCSQQPRHKDRPRQ